MWRETSEAPPCRPVVTRSSRAASLRNDSAGFRNDYGKTGLRQTLLTCVINTMRLVIITTHKARRETAERHFVFTAATASTAGATSNSSFLLEPHLECIVTKLLTRNAFRFPGCVLSSTQRRKSNSRQFSSSTLSYSNLAPSCCYHFTQTYCPSFFLLNARDQCLLFRRGVFSILQDPTSPSYMHNVVSVMACFHTIF